MTVLASVPKWPEGDQGKVLLHLLVDGNVDSLFDDLFGSYPELQAKLHRQRNDTNCAETPWVPQRADLPGQQFMWPAPPAGADPGTPGQGKCRKVRFEAAPSMASKAFSSEEVQVIHAYSPGSHYLVQAEVYTTAMYGDQFCIISRTSLVARGLDKTQLHINYAIHFKPTISRLLKPMVAKGVDGGIRGTFSLLKKLLQEQYTLRDLPETAVGPEMPGEAAPAAAVPAVLVPAPAPQPVPAAAAAAARPLLFQLADYIVYQELVSGILSISDPSVVAKGFAMCLTLAMLHVIITLLRPILQACSAASSGGSGLLGLLCWPLVGVLDLPDNVTEVLSSLLLVAAANRLLMLGTEAASVWMRAPSASRNLSGLPPDVSLPNGVLPAPAEAAEAAGAGSAVSRAGSAGAVRRRTASGQLSPGAGAAMAPTGPAASPAPASDAPGTPLDNVFNNLGHVVSGWGRNLLGGSALDSIFTGASWSRPSSAAAMTAALEGGAVPDKSGQGPGSGGPDGLTSSASSTANSSSSTPARALSHRHTTSFTATMDPSGLNIIEDYAPEPQQQQQHMPRLAEEQQQQQQQNEQQQLSGIPTSAPAGAAGSTAAVKKGSAMEAAVESSLARPPSPDGPAAATAATGGGSGSAASSAASSRSASPTKAGDRQLSRLAVTQAAATSSAAAAAAAASQHHAVKPLKSVAREVLATDADTEDISRQGSLRQPLLAAASQSSMDESANGAAGSLTKQSEAPAAAAGSEASTASATAAVCPPARAASGTKAVAFSADTNNKERSPSRADRLAGSFCAGSAGSHDRSSLARRSASPALWGSDKEAAAGGPGSRSISRSSMRSDGQGDGLGYEALSGGPSYVVPGEEEEDEVLVEVFEHERVQPFRGWGHTWPGHFLPSDRVGHWGDRSGAPGGATSMLFDRVAPKLPVGWAWKDDEWTVDMSGAEHEGCDADGWSYGMDFSWLTWPPGPQTGKPGLKSFVRRRRWVRTRERLPPGSYDLQSSELQQQLAAFQQQQHDMGRSSGGGSGAGEGSLMAGLGAGAGLFSQDSKAAAQAAAAQAAAAASQAASAMMNRFMRAVADLPAQGSGGGSAPTSPPEGALAASPGRADTGGSAQAHSAAGTAVNAGAAASQHSVFSPTSSRPEAAPAVTPGTGQAEGTAAVADSSATDDVDSSSSSVDSGTPPPRPKFTPAASKDLAEGQGPCARSPARQLQHQLEHEAAASTPLTGSAAPAASGDVFGTVANQPSVVQEASASAAGQESSQASSQESSQESPAAASALSVSTAEPEAVADAEPLAGLRPSTVTSSGDWEWSLARVASPTAATAGSNSTSSRAATDSDAASASVQTASHAGSTAAHAGATEPAAAAAAPTGTHISTLQKAGSGITATSSPRVGGAGRGAARAPRSSSGGGSRSGRGKLGAVSLRHSAEAALRSPSGGAAWGSGVLLSPTPSQAVEISPATLLAAGGTSTESCVDSSAVAEREFASTCTVAAAFATTTPASWAATGTFGSDSSSSRLASSISAAAARSSDAASAVSVFSAGMCEGMSGSLSPLRAAAGTTDTVAGTTTVLPAPKQDAVTPAAVEAELLPAGSRAGQSMTDTLASAARETAGSAEIGCSSSEAAALQVAVRAHGSKAAASAAAVGLGEAAAAQSQPATAGPGPGTAVGDTSAGYAGGISASQSERANATSPFSTNSSQSATSIGPAAGSTATGQELGAGLDAVYSVASGISGASSAAAGGDTASTAVQDAGAADFTSADEAPQASSTADVASEAVGSVGDAAEGGAAAGAAEDATAGHISSNHTTALGSSTSDAATGGTAEDVHASAHSSQADDVPGQTASLVAAAEGGQGASAADVPQ